MTDNERKANSWELLQEKASYIIEIAEKLKSQQMMTVNPIAAQIKLTEMLKTLNDSH